MLQFLTDAAAKVRGRRRPARRRVRRPLTVERLEDRVVLSPVPVGPEFRVNTTAAGDQFVDRVAMDADGDSVVVWTSQQVSSGGQHTDSDAYAQRYTTGGVPAGGEFRVNTSTEGGNSDADVAMEPDGDFVAVWFRRAIHDTPSGPAFGESLGIFAQRYSRTGALRGTEFPVTSTVDGGEAEPSVAVAANKAFVIVWSESGGGGRLAIVGQRFDALGVPQGGEFVVVQSTVPDIGYGQPRVAMAPDGQFVVIWRTFDGVQGDIVGQRYSLFGVAQGTSFLVNTTTAGNQVWPAVAMDGKGNFVVTWESWDAGFTFTVFAQRYSADGVRVGSEFQVNTTEPGQQPVPAVAMNRDGEFVVVWGGSGPADARGIFGQRYTAAGLRVGEEFQVNSTTLGGQLFPSVAMDAAGRLLVSWSGDGPGDSLGVFAQRYGVPVPVPGTTFVFFFLGFCGQVGEDPPSGMEKLRMDITADPDLAGTVVAAPPLGWPANPCVLRPFVVRRQMRAARLQVRQFLGNHQYDQRSDRVVLIGHSYGGNIAYELAVERAAGRRRQKPDPVEGLVTLDPIDWQKCSLFPATSSCDQSSLPRVAPKGILLTNILDFVQRSPTEPEPFAPLVRFRGYEITGGRTTVFSDTWHQLIDNDVGLGPDLLPGRASIDDDANGEPDDASEAGTAGTDDRKLQIYDAVLEFLEGLLRS